MKIKTALISVCMVTVMTLMPCLYVGAQSAGENDGYYQMFAASQSTASGFERSTTEQISDRAVDYILKALQNCEKKIDVSAFAIPTDWILNGGYFALLEDNPSIYHVATGFYYSDANDLLCEIEPLYVMTKQEYQSSKSLFEAAVARALDVIDPAMRDVEKVFAIHNYLVLFNKYDLAAYYDDSDDFTTAYTAYGGLVEGRAVCSGYALAFNYLMQQLGIENNYVASDDMGHAWTQVKLNGKWYHLDLTWDDQVYDTQNDDFDFEGHVSHEFVLLSDTTMSDVEHEHYGSDSPYHAVDQTYESYPFVDINTAMFYHAGRWYYGEDYFYGGALKSARFDGTDEKKIDIGNLKVYALAQSGEYLYFTASENDKIDADRIMRIRFDGTGLETVLDNTSNRRISELSILSDQLRYVVGNGSKYTLHTMDLSDLAGTPKANGWVSRQGAWYFYRDGVPATGWEKYGNSWYYFTQSGVMQTGWIADGLLWYYCVPNGEMQTGWTLVNGTWYYMSTSGVMQTSWVYTGGKWYYLRDSGAMATGWVLVGNQWYFLHASGAMATGWIYTGGKWYYLESSGAMRTKPLVYQGTAYSFNADGSMK